MFSLASLEAKVLIVLVALATGFGSGYYTKARFDKATTATEQVRQAEAANAQLRQIIAEQKAALEADAVKATEDATKITELERTANELQAKISDGTALPASDTQRLLEWWDAQRQRTNGKPSGSSR